VLIAPYDVRQGNFAGGLINAVTQSGTNQFHGSVFGRYQNQDLVGTDVNGLKSPDFKVLQYGGTLSGAIIQDKLQYFLAADISERTTPFDGITLEESGLPATRNVMITQHARHAVVPAARAPSKPNRTYFCKLTAPTITSRPVV
jgi:hypothetical protein